MGISGNPELLVDLPRVQKDQIPLLQRFSGGGTVVIDESTLLITFIFSKGALPIAAFPEPILRWSAELYASAWQIPSFHLLENDYLIENRKCGGNAQYIQKDRWLHHTSFLWDYKTENMSYLLLPPKRPKYRNDRPHEEFLCRLKDHTEGPHQLIEKLKAELVKRFYIEEFDWKNWEPGPHRQALRLISGK